MLDKESRALHSRIPSILLWGRRAEWGRDDFVEHSSVHVLVAPPPFVFKVSQLTKAKQTLTKKLDETKSLLDGEVQARSKTVAELRTAQDELAKVKDQLDDEERERADLQRLVSKTNAEMLQMQQRLDNQAAGAAMQELDDIKRKMNARIQDVTSALEAAQTKASNAEKGKAKMQSEIDLLAVELEKVWTQYFAVDAANKILRCNETN
jgi:chromosome segregation ATPase